MFEFDKYQATKHCRPGVEPVGRLLATVKVERAAFLLWGEHCIECAAPDCFKTCDLYVPRPDGRCRRFEFGFAPNTRFQGARGAAAEVVFGHWAKLEARGNARMITSRKLRLLEATAIVISRTLNRVGRMCASILRDERWKYLTFALFERINGAIRRSEARALPDGFLVDIYNPMNKTVDFLLTMSISIPRSQRSLTPDSVPRPLQKRLAIAPGQHRELIPYLEFRDIIESRLPFNIALTPQNADGHHVVLISLDLVKLALEERKNLRSTPESALGQVRNRVAAKCVVFDLDNTLWRGVLLESDDVHLRPEVRGMLEALDQRGILLSIASKNAHDHAIAKLRDLGLEEYFVCPKINWGPKSESLRQIASDLNIGIDTFVFVDDNRFELEEVARTCSDVECIDVSMIGDLVSHPRLQGSASTEARTRRKMYREEMVRTEAQTAFGADYVAFLKASNIHVTIRQDAPDDLERIVELVQRTNQLNFSGHKYTRPEILELLKSRQIERYVITCSDKYGNYGTIGFCMARREGTTIRVEDFMLSCRVQGKLIESVLFDHLCSQGGTPVTRIEVNFNKTDRNLPAQQVLEKLGFDVTSSAPICRSVTARTFAVDFIRVARETKSGFPFAV